MTGLILARRSPYSREPETVTELVHAKVFHARVRPKRHAFSYSVPYLMLSLKNLKREKSCALFSLGRFNLFSFHGADHGDGKTDPYDWIKTVLGKWGVEANGEVLLFTLPRVLGYVFNPVSFWFCFDSSGALRAVLAEVNNTFGERHCYLCCHDDRRAIGDEDWLTTDKIFHVSPFMTVEGFYRFRFSVERERLGVQIDHHDEAGLKLSTSVSGRRKTLNSRQLLGCLARNPLLSFKVIGLIHWQAAKLVLKGLRHMTKPLPPLSGVSR